MSLTKEKMIDDDERHGDGAVRMRRQILSD